MGPHCIMSELAVERPTGESVEAATTLASLAGESPQAPLGQPDPALPAVASAVPASLQSSPAPTADVESAAAPDATALPKPVASAPPVETRPLGIEGECWICEACTFENRLSSSRCSMCGVKRPWPCRVCTFINRGESELCAQCFTWQSSDGDDDDDADDDGDSQVAKDGSDNERAQYERLNSEQRPRRGQRLDDLSDDDEYNRWSAVAPGELPEDSVSDYVPFRPRGRRLDDDDDDDSGIRTLDERAMYLVDHTGSLFKVDTTVPAAPWTCGACTCENTAQALMCEACEGFSPRVVPAGVDLLSAGILRVQPQAIRHAEVQPAPVPTTTAVAEPPAAIAAAAPPPASRPPGSVPATGSSKAPAPSVAWHPPPKGDS
eukprot:c3521_g1_i2.p1 GENE.c3521_g1_i2~~c3521_g1_i2.p1  ORF type:complete len:377 (+),score=26.14 c3521_g1_i2:3-1133(+)